MAKRYQPGSEGCEAQPGSQTRRAAQLIVAFALSTALLSTPSGRATTAGGAGPDLIFTQVPYRPRVQGPKRGLAFRHAGPEAARIVRASSGRPPQVLTSEFASACDPSLSFDAQRLL